MFKISTSLFISLWAIY